MGQSARIYQADTAGSGLSVPLAAVQRTAAGSAVFVADIGSGVVRLRPIVTGAYGQDRVPVTKGLAANDWVVAAGGHLLRDGQKVVAVDRENHPVGK